MKTKLTNVKLPILVNYVDPKFWPHNKNGKPVIIEKYKSFTLEV